MKIDITNITTRMATKDDAHLPTYDHTKLSNINTCPTWGIIRYSKHLRMPGAKRQLPLEAGIACHEAFSIIRWYQLRHQLKGEHNSAAILDNTLRKLISEERMDTIYESIVDGSTDRANCINLAVNTLETSGYYDDPTDRNRTLTNMEEALVVWINQYDLDKYPIWIRDVNDVKTDVGIEIAFDIVVSFDYIIESNHDCHERNLTCRFTGKLDGLHEYRDDHLLIIDEKTGSRLDNSWLAQWQTSHQLTGYCVATSTFTGKECLNAMARGLKLPANSPNVFDNVRPELVRRTPEMINAWARWFIHSVGVEQEHIDNPLLAPMHTHSCNRYFSACSFIPLCTAETMEDKEEIYKQLEVDEWSPLDG